LDPTTEPGRGAWIGRGRGRIGAGIWISGLESEGLEEHVLSEALAEDRLASLGSSTSGMASPNSPGRRRVRLDVREVVLPLRTMREPAVETVEAWWCAAFVARSSISSVVSRLSRRRRGRGWEMGVEMGRGARRRRLRRRKKGRERTAPIGD
jgi:hypothetical protein